MKQPFSPALGGQQAPILLPGRYSPLQTKEWKTRTAVSLQTHSRKQGQHSFESNGKIGTNGRNKDDTPLRRIEENRDSMRSPLQTKVEREAAVLCNKSGKQAQQSFANNYLETRTAFLCKQKAKARASVLGKRKPKTRTAVPKKQSLADE